MRTLSSLAFLYYFFLSIILVSIPLEIKIKYYELLTRVGCVSLMPPWSTVPRRIFETDRHRRRSSASVPHVSWQKRTIWWANFPHGPFDSFRGCCSVRECGCKWEFIWVHYCLRWWEFLTRANLFSFWEIPSSTRVAVRVKLKVQRLDRDLDPVTVTKFWIRALRNSFWFGLRCFFFSNTKLSIALFQLRWRQ